LIAFLFEQLATYDVDFSDVRGQESAKQAMTILKVGRATTWNGGFHLDFSAQKDRITLSLVIQSNAT